MSNPEINNKPSEELSLDDKFNRIAATIRRYSTRNLSEDQSKQEARVAINYLTLVVDYLREEQKQKDKALKTMPIELLTEKDRKEKL